VRRDPRVYLVHILECIGKIEQFTADGEERFMRDALIQDAVLRNLEVIGEAVKRVPDSFRQQHPQIPWRAIAGLRDILIHQYEGVDLTRVWQIVQTDLPILKQALVSILPPLESLERELSES
jgi:uncharacterized protein with HEPN domain